VHALMQVVHFDTPLQRDIASWVRGTNAFLPSDIAVQWAREVPDQFHCRGSAIARRYAYVVLESPVRPSVEAGRVGWVYRPLDGAAMRQAITHLIGEHDFSSFRAAQCQAKSPSKPSAVSRFRSAACQGRATGASSLRPTPFCTT
jgi:tRNA pseudouridine38-40 synthase